MHSRQKPLRLQTQILGSVSLFSIFSCFHDHINSLEARRHDKKEVRMVKYILLKDLACRCGIEKAYR